MSKKINHKLLSLFLLLFGMYVSGFPQDEGNGGEVVSLSPQLDMLMRVPQTPEAAAFIKHGNIPVNMYTGTPQISIPLHTIQGREFALPISLSYDASGIRVDQIATWVGLGWNLNAGGAVTRMVQGIPDGTGDYGKIYDSDHQEFIQYIQNNNMATGTQHTVERWNQLFDLQRELANGQVDLQPDLFPFNINGLSGTLFINYTTGEAICMEHPQLKVEVDLNTQAFHSEDILRAWSITSEDGTQYIFSHHEFTNHSSEAGPVNAPFSRRYVSAWYISKIISPNNRDEVDFIYSTQSAWENKQDIVHTLSGVSVVNPETNNSLCGGNATPIQYLPGPNDASFYAEQSYLEEIQINGYKRARLYTSTADRADLNGRKRLMWLDFFNLLGTELVQRVHLDNGPTTSSDPGKYFGNVSQGLAGVDEKEVRLKLDGVNFYGNLGFTDEPIQTYEFEYFEPENIPPRNSFAADMWGYYNGIIENTSLVPTYTENGVNLFPQGANRNPNLAACQVGTLKKIIYPTGGETEFAYSLHSLEPIVSTEEITVEEEIMALPGGEDASGLDQGGFATNCFGNWEGNISGFPPLHARASFSVNPNNPEAPRPQNLNVSFEGLGGGSQDFMYFIVYRSGDCRDTDIDCFSQERGFCDLSSIAEMPESNLDITVVLHGDPRVLDGPDAFIAPNLSITRLPNGSFDIDISQLERGGYQILAFNINQGETLKVNISKEETLTEEDPQVVGGLRVVEMIDKTDANTPATHRYFQYRDLSPEEVSFNQTESMNALLYPSSGKAMYNPVFTSKQYNTFCNIGDENGAFADPVTCERTSVFSSFLYQGSGHVGYSTVSEIQYDPNEGINGFTVYGFYNETSSLDKIPKLYANLNTYLNGRPKFTKVFTRENELVSESSQLFSINQLDGSENEGGLFSNPGILFESSESYTGYRIVSPVPNSSNGVLTFFIRCDNPTIDLNAAPPECDNALRCDGGNFPSNQQITHFTYSSFWIKSEESTQKTYVSGNPMITPVSTRTQYFCENSAHKQVTRIITESSDNTIRETKLYYPDDVLPSVYTVEEETEIRKLGKDNLYHINEVVATEQFYNGANRIFLEKRTYETFTNLEDLVDRTLLTGIANSSGTNTLEKVAEFEYLNNSAYPIEIKRPEGPPTIIMYSYKEYLPVIQIQGIDFSNGADGLTDQMPTIINLLAKDDPNAIQADLVSIRQNFPRALITTYDYDERLLLESITGPDGVKISYEYDPLGRLIQSSDDDDKLLQAIKYNYAQP